MKFYYIQGQFSEKLGRKCGRQIRKFCWKGFVIRFLFSMFRTQGNNSIRLTPSEGISVLYEGPKDLNEFEVGDIRNYS